MNDFSSISIIKKQEYQALLQESNVSLLHSNMISSCQRLTLPGNNKCPILMSLIRKLCLRTHIRTLRNRQRTQTGGTPWLSLLSDLFCIRIKRHKGVFLVTSRNCLERPTRKKPCICTEKSIKTVYNKMCDRSF